MKSSIGLFNHRYKKTQKFTWLEMLDFAEAFAAESINEMKICTGCGRLTTDPPLPETALACCPDNHYLPIRKYWERSSFPSNEYKPHKQKGGQ